MAMQYTHLYSRTGSVHVRSIHADRYCRGLKTPIETQIGVHSKKKMMIAALSTLCSLARSSVASEVLQCRISELYIHPVSVYVDECIHAPAVKQVTHHSFSAAELVSMVHSSICHPLDSFVRGYNP